MAIRVLITDGEQRAALALVRSLGRAGYEPLVGSTALPCLAGASRATAATVKTPDPLSAPEQFVNAIREIVIAHRVAVVIPTTEASLRAVLPAANDLAGAVVPFPSAAAFNRISDKREVLRVAAALGMSVPSQVEIEAPSDVAQTDLEALRYPVVLKPSRSVAVENGHRTRHGVSYASSASDLGRQLLTLSPGAFPVLVQQRIVGPGIGVFLLVWGDEVLAVFSHRRLREKPPSGGVSVYAESIPADPFLVAKSRELLARFDWQGVAMVEFKMSVDTATPYVMEVNGRFWGSLQLAIDSGMDFPVLLLRAALGQQVAPQHAYRTGVRNRWWWGDVDQLLTRWRHSHQELSLPDDAPSRVRSLAAFLTLWRRGDRNEVFRWSDPAPFVRESLNWLSTQRL